MRLLSAALCVSVFMSGLVGCVGSTTRVEVGRELVSDPTAVSVQDFETIAQKMARGMVAIGQVQNASQPPTIAFLSVENRSNDFIDKKAFLEKMRTLLIRNANGKMIFLDRYNLDALRDEQAAKDGGEFTSSGRGQLYGADFFLTGVISSINAAGGSERTIYRRYSFRLVDANTGAIVWEDEYETQLYQRRGSIYR